MSSAGEDAVSHADINTGDDYPFAKETLKDGDERFREALKNLKTRSCSVHRMKTRFKGKGNSRLSSIFTNKSQTLRVNDSEELICAGNAGNASSVIDDL